MTEKDRKLMEVADRFAPSAWYECDQLAEQAESAEAKDYIHTVAGCLYHRDEGYLI